MVIDSLPIADGSSSDSALVLIGAVIGAATTIIVAGVTPIGEWINRKDSLKSYRRNVYRNFLDHAYWYRDESLDDDKRQERAEKYVADWHRIQLIGGPEVQAATKGLQAPGCLSPDKEPYLISVFQRELKIGGLTED
jgi:hypothetical protein